MFNNFICIEEESTYALNYSKHSKTELFTSEFVSFSFHDFVKWGLSIPDILPLTGCCSYKEIQIPYALWSFIFQFFTPAASIYVFDGIMLLPKKHNSNLLTINLSITGTHMMVLLLSCFHNYISPHIKSYNGTGLVGQKLLGQIPVENHLFIICDIWCPMQFLMMYFFVVTTVIFLNIFSFFKIPV